MTYRTFKSQPDQRISYVDPTSIEDADMLGDLDRCALNNLENDAR